MSMQGELFPDPANTEPPVDIDALAHYISENARKVVYEDRTSDAARDQGWGPVELPTAEVPDSPVVRDKKLYEVPGRNRNGRSNTPRTLRPHEAQKGLTDEEIDRLADNIHTGTAAIRATYPDLFKKD